MSVMLSAVWLLSFLLFLGTVRLFAQYRKPGAYPPKHIVKKQMITLGSGCIFFFLLGLVLSGNL